MLLHQGAAAFTLWTGQPAPLELMQAEAGGGAGRRAAIGRGRAERGRRRPRTGRRDGADTTDAAADGEPATAERARLTADQPTTATDGRLPIPDRR